ncbi:MAG: glycosyltransferase [Tissierellia bacterium]|nr:glycosyltransferase [Tissierellia bacterium]
MATILMVVKTTGLAYDDRIRKECLTFIELGHFPTILVLSDDNDSRRGITDYGIPFIEVCLKTRNYLPDAKGLLVKTFEMYLKMIPHIKQIRPDVIWIHNIEMAGLVPIAMSYKKKRWVKKIIWDQHELIPNRLMKFPFKTVIKNLVKKCDAVIQANVERKDFFINIFRINPEKVEVLENFVDKIFLTLPPGSLPAKVSLWLDQKPYFLAQGGGDPGRYLSELVEAIIRLKKAKLIVVGPYEQVVVDVLKKQFNNEFDEWILLTGKVPQLELVNYIDNTIASVIFYQSSNRNSFLCAPNRLYQALARGVPVIVGCNPPMKHLVERLKNGVVLEDDGKDSTQVYKGLMELFNNYLLYAEQAKNNKHIFKWEKQSYVINELLHI